MQSDPQPIVCPDGICPASRGAFEMAVQFVRGGVSVLPIEADGTKSPALAKWTPLQEQFATEKQLAEWYSTPRPLGVATIGGMVSGNMELLDFDRDAGKVFPAWRDMVESEFPGLIQRLSVVETPGQGYHVRYRCPGVAIPGNKDLALYPADGPAVQELGRVIIQTRGEGGYALAPGCPAECHESGRLYQQISGPTIPATITAAERDCLIRCARSFDESPAKTPKAMTSVVPRPSNGDDLRPGDDFDRRGWDWADILEPHGWKLSHGGKDGVRYWRRPGKTDPGWSATTGKCRGSQGEELLRVFSSNAHPFEDGCAYGKFRAYVMLSHGGDYSAAAQELARHGFGSGSTSGVRLKMGSRLDPSEITEAEDYHLTDLGNAKRVASAHGHEMRFSHAQKTWYIWDGRRWKGDDSGEAMRRVKATQADYYEQARAALDAATTKAEQAEAMKAIQHALKWEDARRIAATLKLLESEPGIPIAIDEIDRSPWLLNCLNGTIDLRTGKIRAHDPLDSISKLAPVNYDPHAECPNWLRCLDDWMCGKPALTDYLRRIIGYSLTGDVREQVLFFLYGGGSNGKSTFLGLVREMLGEYGHQSVSELLMQRNTEAHPTERAALFGKRFVATIETDQGKRMAEALMKQMTGGDPIQARKMRQDFFEFLPTWKIFLAANHKPNIKGQDYAVWRRIRLIPWLASFRDGAKDLALPEKLKAEMSGILAWAVRGCLEWQQSGLNDPQEVTDATAGYQREQDTLGSFLSECCVIAQFAKVQSSALLKAYQEWSGDKTMARQTLQKRLNERGFSSYRKSGSYWYEGIGLDSDNYEDNETRFV